MGIAFSCPFSDFYDLDSQLEAVFVRSFGSGKGDMGTAMRSVSFNGRDLEEPAALIRSYGSGKILLEGSFSFEGKELSTTLSVRSPAPDSLDKKVKMARSISLKTRGNGDRSDSLSKKNVDDVLLRFQSLPKEMPCLSLPESGAERHEAALKLQKVYKSFRTRRQLADCAVVVEQRWWKLLDFAELKRSSISFFGIEKPESAISRWSRARTRAAKVGKGLSKDSKARKLALQHWLEAIDPRHRYGHNLQFYYVKWLHCQSKQPFFYWLDIGEGKEVNLERCPRSKLHQQCIKYLGPMERQAYEVEVKDGKFFYKQSGIILDTTQGPKDSKWIFVLNTSKTLYVGKKNKGTFQHSSFLAGGATLSAGRLVIEDGVLKAVWPHSGHYLPTEENFQEFMLFLREHNIDVSKVEKSPTEGEEEGFIKKGDGFSFRNEQSEAELLQDPEFTNVESLNGENMDSRQQDSNDAENTDTHTSKLFCRLRSNVTKLKIPTRTSLFDNFEDYQTPIGEFELPDSSEEDGYVSAEDSFLTEEDFMFPKYNLFDDDEEADEEPILKEKIMKRIDSHKVMKSYQLGQQLSSKWTTGAGPRIGCMRDYPTELQLRVLEDAHLSPRSSSASNSPRNPSRSSPRVSAPTVLTATPTCRETTCSRSPLASGQVI